MKGGPGATQAGCAGDGAEHDVDVGVLRELLEGSGAGEDVARLVHGRSPWACGGFGGEGDDFWLVLIDQSIELVGGVVEGEAEGLEFVGEGLDDIEGALADGAGGAEEGDTAGGGCGVGGLWHWDSVMTEAGDRMAYRESGLKADLANRHQRSLKILSNVNIINGLVLAPKTVLLGAFGATPKKNHML